MPSLKEYRVRINSVKSTQKITKAMKLVAASKLRRARESAEAARPYAERMERMMGSLSASFKGASNAPRLMIGTGRDDVHLVVVCTAARGLCGGFNTNIIRASQKHIKGLLASGKKVKIICVGKKGHDILKREFPGLIEDYIDGIARLSKIEYVHAKQIAQAVLERFDDGQCDVVTLFYSQFESVIKQTPVAQQLIPLPMGDTTTNSDSVIYDYEPDEQAILEDLLPRNIEVQIFHALLENAAGEQGARMSAMDNATRNAGDMIKRLSLEYNRTRQAYITKELIEIISGAEAL